ncbi:MAG: hypothetical protein GY940_00740 [bacterium]|nr:hypothetical protein [bacterium]
MMTKKALKDPETKDGFTILIDRENPKNNIQQFLKDNNIPFQTNSEGDHYRINVKSASGGSEPF